MGPWVHSGRVGVGGSLRVGGRVWVPDSHVLRNLLHVYD